jgi:hypothetical protein
MFLADEQPSHDSFGFRMEKMAIPMEKMLLTGCKLDLAAGEITILIVA